MIYIFSHFRTILIITLIFISLHSAYSKDLLTLTKNKYKKADSSFISIYIIKISPEKYSMSIYYPGKTGTDIEEIKKDKKIECAVNCGFFLETFFPVGLLISEGKTINSIDHSWEHTGVFYITKNQSDPYGICKTSDFYDTDVIEAVQSYPLLVWDNKPYVKHDAVDEAVRTAIALDKKGYIYLIATDGPITLYEFSRSLCRTNYNFTRALNLDGGTSTQMYLKGQLSLCPITGIFRDNRVSNLLIVKKRK